VYGIALMLFYYDQRIRQEAFDIEWMMLKAGLVVPAAQGLMAGVSEMRDATSGEAGPIKLIEGESENATSDGIELPKPTETIEGNTVE
jgi:hypothetical protein